MNNNIFVSERHRLSEYGHKIAKKYKYEDLITKDGFLDSKSYYQLLKVSRRFRYEMFTEMMSFQIPSLFIINNNSTLFNKDLQIKLQPFSKSGKTLHYTLHYIRYITYVTLHYTKLHYNTLPYTF